MNDEKKGSTERERETYRDGDEDRQEKKALSSFVAFTKSRKLLRL